MDNGQDFTDIVFCILFKDAWLKQFAACVSAGTVTHHMVLMSELCHKQYSQSIIQVLGTNGEE